MIDNLATDVRHKDMDSLQPQRSQEYAHAAYVLVPIHPTPAMIEAGNNVDDLYRMGRPELWGRVYSAMLRAAPLPAVDVNARAELETTKRELALLKIAYDQLKVRLASADAYVAQSEQQALTSASLQDPWSQELALGLRNLLVDYEANVQCADSARHARELLDRYSDAIDG